MLYENIYYVNMSIYISLRCVSLFQLLLVKANNPEQN